MSVCPLARFQHWCWMIGTCGSCAGTKGQTQLSRSSRTSGSGGSPWARQVVIHTTRIGKTRVGVDLLLTELVLSNDSGAVRMTLVGDHWRVTPEKVRPGRPRKVDPVAVYRSYRHVLRDCRIFIRGLKEHRSRHVTDVDAVLGECARGLSFSVSLRTGDREGGLQLLLKPSGKRRLLKGVEWADLKARRIPPSDLAMCVIAARLSVSQETVRSAIYRGRGSRAL